MDLGAYREAMRRLRRPNPGQGVGELPEDPDVEHVSAGLRELDGTALTVSGIDCATGELVHEAGTFAVAPGLHGDVARRRQEQQP